MLRKIAAGTSAAVVAAALAVAPAAGAGLPGTPDDPCAGTATCVTAGADFSAVKRKSSGPPPTGTPVPEVPSNPPPDGSGAGGPGPGGGASPAAPPLERAGPPSAPDITPAPPPPPEPAPTPTTAPAEPGRPSEAILPTAEAPTRLPQTAADSRPLTVVGGGSLIAAGLAWIGGARRRRVSAA